jgi:hypothetical protein
VPAETGDECGDVPADSLGGIIGTVLSSDAVENKVLQRRTA